MMLKVMIWMMMLLTVVCLSSNELSNDANTDAVYLATKGPHQSNEPGSVYEWIQRSIISRTPIPFMTLGDIMKRRSSSSRSRSSSDSWSRLTPRTAVFARLFASLRHNMTSAEFVEAMLSAGMDSLVLETLPEALSTPMREAIADCQAQPPVPWNEDLLCLIGRNDLNALAGTKEVAASSSLMVSSKPQPTQYWMLKRIRIWFTIAT